LSDDSKTRVPEVEQMTDEAVCSHLERRHKDDVAMEFEPEVAGKPRRLLARIVWDTYHARLHATKDDHDHVHVHVTQEVDPR
jgi:hypothetical protein